MNRGVIVAVIILMAGGLYSVMTGKGAPTQTRKSNVVRVIIGTYVLAILVTILDLVGAPVQGLTTAILVTAIVTTLIAILPDILNRISTRPQGAPATPASKLPTAQPIPAGTPI
jgi:hypothetical protein